MTKVDIFSGFLGAGKTTLIKKLIAEAYKGEKLVLIENEFGDIAIDGGFMQDAGIEVTEMNSGCICCSLVGDFEIALGKVIAEFAPDRILIEPSGVGKLSDITRAVEAVDGIVVNSATTVVDAAKCKKYAKNFGEFYDDQIKNARAIILSRTAGIAQDALDLALRILRERNSEAVIVTTPWDELDGKAILAAMEGADSLKHEIEALEHEHHEHHHHHHHDECHHEHHHHHEHDEHCSCGCHDHEHHHHHHADEVFSSWGKETAKHFTAEELASILASLDDEERFGYVLRAKGIVPASDGEWLHFDYVPEESNIRRGSAGVTGRFCVIGSHINEAELAKIFGA